MKKYNSKIGRSIILILLAIFGSAATLMIVQKIWLGLAIVLLTAVFILQIILSTYYIIQGTILTVKSSAIINESISIKSIIRVSETRNPLGAPASSLDRLMIKHQKGRILISPKEKADFISHLLRINPDIEVVYRK